MKIKTLLFYLLVLLALGLICATPVLAATFKEKDTLVIPRGETIKDDFYGVGANVHIEGKVDGDALVAGNNIVIDGEVTGDLIAAGGTVFINGYVGDDVRMAGGTIYVNGDIQGDLVVGGGQVLISDKSRVGQSMIIGSGTLQANGPVGKNLLIGAGTVALNNRVGKDAKISADNITLGPDAKIKGNLLSIGTRRPKLSTGAAVDGRMTHRFVRREAEQRRVGGLAGLAGLMFYLIFMFVTYLAAIITGVVIIALFPGAVNRSTQMLDEGLWKSLGIGFVALIIVPVAAIILMITLLGLPLGLMSLAFYAVFLYLSQLFFSVFLGEKIIGAITKAENVSPYWSLLLGFSVISIISLVPFVGWLVKFIAGLFGLGALVLISFEKMGRGKEPVTGPAAQG